MASHLNAHNMPSPGVDDDSTGKKSSTKWLLLWLVVAIIGFIALDRASLALVPAQYHNVPDVDSYHTLYYSLKFQQFDKIKENVETVILGDSRARHGVDPALFTDQEDHTNITAYNFAPASSGIDFTDVLIREYLCDLPSLRTVVWGISPRIFNRYWQDPICKLFVKSNGYQLDKLSAGRRATHHLFTRLSAAFAHRSKLKSITLDGFDSAGSDKHFHVEQPCEISDWGYMELPESEVVDVSDNDVVKKILGTLESGRFDPNQARIEKFRGLIHLLAQKNIRLVCFVPPMHHSLMQSPAADADGTPDADYAKLISTLKSFETEFANYHFVDIHNAGDNGFTDDQYGDFEHLNRTGSQKLSRMIGEHLQQINSVALSVDQNDLSTTASNDLGSQKGSESDTDSAIHEPIVSGDQDTVGPEIVSHLDDLDYMVGAFPPDNRPLLWAEYEDDGSGIDTNSIRFLMDDEDITDKCKITEEKVSFKPAKTLEAPHLYEFKVIVFDKAGNKSELVWEILLKPC
ncbi:MAG: hypothetical protein ACYSWP_01535 [Planctomycetota bacterium]|jgi:hypothetical protein